MPKPIRLILAVLVGSLVGMFVNGGLVTLGPMVIPPPEGADITTVEGLKAAMPLLQPKHFLFPFLAHAVGTLVGALIATMLAGRSALAAYIVGGLFFIGGCLAAMMIPAPAWFIVLDLVVSYFPMAWIAHRLAFRGQVPAHAGA